MSPISWPFRKSDKMIFRRRRPSMTCTPVPPSWLFTPRREGPIFEGINTMVILTDFPPKNTTVHCLGVGNIAWPPFFDSATSTSLYSSEAPWFGGHYYLSKTSEGSFHRSCFLRHLPLKHGGIGRKVDLVQAPKRSILQNVPFQRFEPSNINFMALHSVTGRSTAHSTRAFTMWDDENSIIYHPVLAVIHCDSWLVEWIKQSTPKPLFEKQKNTHPKKTPCPGPQDYRFPPELTWQKKAEKNRWCASSFVGWMVMGYLHERTEHNSHNGGFFLGCTTNRCKNTHLITRISRNVHSSREPTKNTRKWWTNANNVMTFAFFTLS